MATAEQHIRTLVGTLTADLMVQLAMARARIDELEQQLRQSPAPQPAEEPR
jgi:hypothetical protein